MNPVPAFRAAILAAFPSLATPRSAFQRVIRVVGARLSVQKISEADGAPDAKPIEVWPGVPGVTSDASEGEEVITAFIGDDQIPVVIARASEQAPGNVPVRVRHDATTEIRFLSRPPSLTAKVLVGSAPTVPVAKAGEVDAIKAALLGFTAAIALTPTTPGIVAAAAALQTALNSIPSAASTNLEAR